MKSVIRKIGEIPKSATDTSVIRQDKNGRNYKQTAWGKLDKEYMDIPGEGKTLVHAKVRTTTVNLYEKSYLPSGEMHFGYDLPVGTYAFGDIVTRKVKPYNVPDRRKNALPGAEITVDSYTCVVFGDTTSGQAWEQAVQQAFRSHGHEFPASESAASESEAVNVLTAEQLRKLAETV